MKDVFFHQQPRPFSISTTKALALSVPNDAARMSEMAALSKQRADEAFDGKRSTLIADNQFGSRPTHWIAAAGKPPRIIPPTRPPHRQ